MGKPKTKEHLLEPHQIKKVEKAIKNELEALAFYGIMFTGMRVSEFLHLNRDWINWRRKLIVIPDKMKCNCLGCTHIRNDIRKKKKRFDAMKVISYDDAPTRGRRLMKKRTKLNERQKTRLDGYWVPKTATSERTIPIVEEAMKVIYPYFKKNKAILDVFPARQYINNTLNRLGKRSKVKIFPHCLRGTFATMLAVKGFSEFQITQSLGWADINVAVFYIKLSGAALQNAFDEKWSTEFR